MTLNQFNPRKMREFIEEGLADINLTNPLTSAALSSFLIPSADGLYPDLPIIATATWLAVMRHLMRSYAEQPQPMGANVVYEDRRDYFNRWQSMYQIEQQTLTRWIALWKRQFLGLGEIKTLVSSKAGRMTPGPMRTRFVGRGYW